MSFYNHFEEAIDKYNSNQAFLGWIMEELIIHPDITIEQISKLAEVEP